MRPANPAGLGHECFCEQRRLLAGSLPNRHRVSKRSDGVPLRQQHWHRFVPRPIVPFEVLEETRDAAQADRDVAPDLYVTPLQLAGLCENALVRARHIYPE